MNIEEIVKLAQQVQDEGFAPVGIWPEVRRLCELAYAAGADAEREACAAVCYRHAAFVVDPIDRERIYQCADAILARGQA